MSDHDNFMRLASNFHIQVMHNLWCATATPYPIFHFSMEPDFDLWRWNPMIGVDKTGMGYDLGSREETKQQRILYLLEQVKEVYFEKDWWTLKWVWDDFNEADMVLSRIEYKAGCDPKLLDSILTPPDTDS